MSARNALLFMAGQAAPAAAPVTATPPAASVPADDSDVLDVHIKKAAGSWWQFFIGAGVGIAGAVVVYKVMQPARRESVVDRLTER